MKIAIDISQTAYEGTGVSEYVTRLVEHLIKIDQKNEYILFFSSMRKNLNPQIAALISKNVDIKTFRLPPIALDILWNRLHIAPIEWFIGDVDVFISSDWTAPPTTKAKKATILYDLIVYKFPKETDSKIITTQKRRLSWVKKECDVIFCISQASKQDAVDILAMDEERLRVIHPGI